MKKIIILLILFSFIFCNVKENIIENLFLAQSCFLIAKDIELTEKGMEVHYQNWKWLFDKETIIRWAEINPITEEIICNKGYDALLFTAYSFHFLSYMILKKINVDKIRFLYLSTITVLEIMAISTWFNYDIPNTMDINCLFYIKYF